MFFLKRKSTFFYVRFFSCSVNPSSELCAEFKPFLFPVSTEFISFLLFDYKNQYSVSFINQLLEINTEHEDIRSTFTSSTNQKNLTGFWYKTPQFVKICWISFGPLLVSVWLLLILGGAQVKLLDGIPSPLGWSLVLYRPVLDLNWFPLLFATGIKYSGLCLVTLGFQLTLERLKDVDQRIIWGLLTLCDLWPVACRLLVQELNGWQTADGGHSLCPHEVCSGSVSDLTLIQQTQNTTWRFKPVWIQFSRWRAETQSQRTSVQGS